MANFKSSPQGNNDWPSTPHNKLVENDPMIVLVPMAACDIGDAALSKAKSAASGHNSRMAIKHTEGKGGA